MWACHNEREENRWVSPREPEYFITPSEHGQGGDVRPPTGRKGS
jgi:hypothetical protein